jgi:serine/threonine protein phosphatase PrpC
MQGWRISMEDSHTTVLDLLAGTEAAKNHASKLSFFGVFDGHGGDKVALFAGANIHNIIAKQDTFKAGNYEQALKASGWAFASCDRPADWSSLNRSQIRRRGFRLYGLCRVDHRR